MYAVAWDSSMTKKRVSDDQTLTYDLGNEIELQPRGRHLEVTTFSARHLHAFLKQWKQNSMSML